MLEDLAQALLDYTKRMGGENPWWTAIDGMAILRADHPRGPTPIMSRPSLCIVAQGTKWATFGKEKLEYTAGEALVVGVEAPSVGRVVEASPGTPCLVLLLMLDLDILREVAESMDELPQTGADQSPVAFVADVTGSLGECALRLVRLLDTPKAIPTLYPGLMREICYWLLNGPNGGEIARIAIPKPASRQIMEALSSLRDRFAETVRVEDLAAVAQMSVSAFHRQFKALTRVSPLQYQKHLRLLEARRLIISTGQHAEAAAFAVGYESASQFSREYARMFGEPPKRDLKRVKSSMAGAVGGPQPDIA